MRLLPLSPGPPVGLIYCLCFLAYFNEDVLFLEGTAAVPPKREAQFYSTSQEEQAFVQRVTCLRVLMTSRARVSCVMNVVLPNMEADGVVSVSW